MNPVYVVQKMPYAKKFLIDVIIATGTVVVMTVVYDNLHKGLADVKARWDAL
jgi:hypothetical protein